MADSGENLIGVLFVLALIYLGLLFLGFLRSYPLVFKKEGNTQRHRRIFTGFYSLVWATLILTITLYFSVTAQFFNSKANTLGVVAFYFLPLILMVFCYVLLYYQLELMMTVSRIESSQNYVRRFNKSHKLKVCMRIIILGLIALFIGVQLLLMVLVFFEIVTFRAFFIELIVFIGLIVLGLNIN